MHIKDIKSWDAQSVTDKLIYLRGFIKIGHIKSVKTHELVEFLVLLANTPFTDDAKAKEEVERYTSLVQHLLQVRLTQELHRRSFWISVFAIIISLAAVFLSWMDFNHKYEPSHSKQPQTQPAIQIQAPKK